MVIDVVRFGMILLLSCSCIDTPVAKKRILFISKGPEVAYHKAIIKGAKREAIRNNYEIEILGASPEKDFQTQVDAISDLIKLKNYDAVILEPNDSSALVRSLVDLNGVKIPFVIVDTKINFVGENLDYYCGFVGTDNFYGGRIAAHALGTLIKAGNVVVVRGLASHRSSQDREKGFVELLQDQYPELRIVKFLDGEWSGTIAEREYRKFLGQKPPTINAVFALNDDMAVAISKVYSEKNWRPKIIGFDGSVDAQKKILYGQIDASVVQTPSEMGRMAVRTIDRYFQAGKCEGGEILTPVRMISPMRTLNIIIGNYYE